MHPCLRTIGMDTVHMHTHKNWIEFTQTVRIHSNLRSNTLARIQWFKSNILLFFQLIYFGLFQLQFCNHDYNYDTSYDVLSEFQFVLFELILFDWIFFFFSICQYSLRMCYRREKMAIESKKKTNANKNFLKFCFFFLHLFIY